MYSDNTPGLLVVRVFVAQHDNPSRGRAVKVYSYPCHYGDAPSILAAWRKNNTWAQSEYNSSRPPIDARFELGSVSL